MNNILISFLVIQAAILIGILAINIKVIKEIKKMIEKIPFQQQTGYQPPVLKNNVIPPVNTKSVNLNEIVKVDGVEEHEHILAFVNPSCTACKDLFSNTELDQSIKEKLIVVTADAQNMEYYDGILTNKGIPIIESKELANHLGIRAFPTVVHIDKNLKVKEYFVGSNYRKFKEYIQSA